MNFTEDVSYFADKKVSFKQPQSNLIFQKTATVSKLFYELQNNWKSVFKGYR